MTGLPAGPLGTSGLEITVVGFRRVGRRRRRLGLRLGAAGRRRVDRGDAPRARSRRQLDRYGGGLRPRPLGGSRRPVLQDLPAADRPLVFTKCGLQWDDDDRMASPRRVAAPGVHPPRSARRRCGGWASSGSTCSSSTGRTRRACRSRTRGRRWRGWSRQGKVRAAGVSNFDVTLLERCEAIRHVDSLQSPFSLIRRGSPEREIPWCARTAPA